MNAVNKVVKIVTRREYLGFALCWLLWIESLIFPETYKNNWIVIGLYFVIFGGFWLIRKYGN